MIRFTLPFDPVAKGRPRMSRHGHAYTPAKTRRFEAAVKAYAAVFAPKEPLVGPVKLTARYYFKPPKKGPAKPHLGKPDLSNLSKALEDALNGMMWKDDSQITSHETEKMYDWVTKNPRIEVRIEAAN